MPASIGPFSQGLQHIVRENEPLGPLTWLKIGGPARFYAEPTSESELVQFVQACHANNIPVRVLGGGSNLLIRESGFEGAVLSIAAAAFSMIQVRANRIQCGSGAKLSHLITHSVGAGLSGLEHLVGIPGSVGGALHGNCSTLSGDIGQRLVSARSLRSDGTFSVLKGDNLHFSTHTSSLDELLILDAEFELEPTDAKSLTTRMQTQWIIKRASQPNSSIAAAIPFVDPITSSAAKLIEQSGMRGAIEGAVQLSTFFPNFLVAGPSATSEQVLALVERVQSAVFKQTGVQLQLHLKIW
ncbi:MAG: FAD-binding protein [Pirellulaceae bacterium]|nr:FAD-binding protein [Pirellulaceae bacterium]